MIDVSDLLVIWANRSQKKSKSLVKIEFYICFWQFFSLSMPKSESLPSLFAHSLFCKEQPERFALVALFKRATMSNSLRSLMTKERREWFPLFHEQIALSLTNNEQIAQKTDSQPCPKGDITVDMMNMVGKFTLHYNQGIIHSPA